MPVQVDAVRPTPVLRFRNRKKDYDAKRIADALGITSSEAAAILDVDPSTVSRNPATPKIRQRAAKLERILSLLSELYGGDYAVAWLKTPSPFWDAKGEMSALDLMAREEWGLDFVLEEVEAIRRGEHSA